MKTRYTNHSFIYNFDMLFAYVRPVDNRHRLCLVGLKFSHGVALLAPTSVLFDQCSTFALYRVAESFASKETIS